jgi:hypothetical protein
MKKFSLINIDYDFEEGDVIIFEMLSFCSGDYEATVISDPKFGLYIDQKIIILRGAETSQLERKEHNMTPEEQRNEEERLRRKKRDEEDEEERQRKRRQEEDDQNSLLNPFNPLSPFSPMNPFSPFNND